MKNEKNLKVHAIYGAILVCFMGILVFGFKSFLLEFFGTGLSLIFILSFGVGGLYLMMPYFTELSDPNKPWNKKF